MYGYYMMSYESYLHLLTPGDLESDFFQSIWPNLVCQGPIRSVKAKFIEIGQFS